MKRIEDPIIKLIRRFSNFLLTHKVGIQRYFLKFDRYVQIALLFFLVINWNNNYQLNAIFSIMVWHITSFLFRLAIPYNKSRFYIYYGIYLVTFLGASIITVIIHFPIFYLWAILSPIAGVGFVINCFLDYERLKKIS